MNNTVRTWIYVIISVILIVNFWMNCNNAHNVKRLQEKQATDSVRLQNLNITIKYVLPNDTSTVSESE